MRKKKVLLSVTGIVQDAGIGKGCTHQHGGDGSCERFGSGG